MKLFILISTLIVIAQAQFGGGRFGGPGVRRFGPGGGFGPGARGFGPGFGGRFGSGFGRFGGVGGFAGRGVFAPAVAVAPVVAVAPIARVVPFGGLGPVGMVGIGGFPRAVVVARPRLLVGRSVSEDFRFSYLPKLKQIELFFGYDLIIAIFFLIFA